MYRKLLLVKTILILLLSLCACSLQGGNDMFSWKFASDQKLANERMNAFLDAVENKNYETVKSLFSINKIANIPDFDEQIKELFYYFEGAVVAWNDQEQPGTEETIEYGKKQLFLMSSYDVNTTSTTYRIYLYDCAIDTIDSDNEGIWSLYIIKLEDDTDTNFVYHGDCKDTPGINIGIKNLTEW